MDIKYWMIVTNSKISDGDIGAWKVYQRHGQCSNKYMTKRNQNTIVDPDTSVKAVPTAQGESRREDGSKSRKKSPDACRPKTKIAETTSVCETDSADASGAAETARIDTHIGFHSSSPPVVAASITAHPSTRDRSYQRARKFKYPYAAQYLRGNKTAIFNRTLYGFGGTAELLASFTGVMELSSKSWVGWTRGTCKGHSHLSPGVAAGIVRRNSRIFFRQGPTGPHHVGSRRENVGSAHRAKVCTTSVNTTASHRVDRKSKAREIGYRASSAARLRFGLFFLKLSRKPFFLKFCPRRQLCLHPSSSVSVSGFVEESSVRKLCSSRLRSRVPSPFPASSSVHKERFVHKLCPSRLRSRVPSKAMKVFHDVFLFNPSGALIPCYKTREHSITTDSKNTIDSPSWDEKVEAKRMEALEGEMEQLKARVEEKYFGVEGRLSTIENRFGNFEEMMKKMLEMQLKASSEIPRVEPWGKEIQEDGDELIFPRFRMATTFSLLFRNSFGRKLPFTTKQAKINLLLRSSLGASSSFGLFASTASSPINMCADCWTDGLELQGNVLRYCKSWNKHGILMEAMSYFSCQNSKTSKLTEALSKKKCTTMLSIILAHQFQQESKSPQKLPPNFLQRSGIRILSRNTRVKHEKRSQNKSPAKGQGERRMLCPSERRSKPERVEQAMLSGKCH
ncbi:hypothetical protein M5K25_012475 [Dendrobium thyrsiflorum]|uniref:Uncharacterized protein n=1 Tax=Dendrobium thyrsiflorum TaxID=117978 RepID=A0ABD0UX51_DENTH